MLLGDCILQKVGGFMVHQRVLFGFISWIEWVAACVCVCVWVAVCMLFNEFPLYGSP